MIKLNRQQIEASLDSKIVDIFVDPNSHKIEQFGCTVRILIKAGYPLKNYLEIYDELKREYIK